MIKGQSHSARMRRLEDIFGPGWAMIVFWRCLRATIAFEQSSPTFHWVHYWNSISNAVNHACVQIKFFNCCSAALGWLFCVSNYLLRSGKSVSLVQRARVYSSSGIPIYLRRMTRAKALSWRIYSVRAVPGIHEHNVLNQISAIFWRDNNELLVIAAQNPVHKFKSAISSGFCQHLVFAVFARTFQNSNGLRAS